MNKLLKVKCPQCDTIFPYYESEFRPFCCERCKMIDLGHWFEESYKVPDNVSGKEVVQTPKQTDENGKKVNEESEIEIENENSYDDYSNIDEDTYDENDY